MAKNDVVLLDSVLEQRIADGLPSRKLDEVFEYFSLEQVLKDFDLSRDELESGWLDGRDDGGIDAFFIFVNGHLLQDPATFAWPKSGALVEIWVFTCKHHATFEQAPINSILASAQELFDLSLARDNLCGAYSEEIHHTRTLLSLAYRRLSVARPDVTFRFCYVSRGDTTEVGENIVARAQQLRSLVESLFSSCTVRFDFVGAAELVDRFRRVKQFSLELPFIEHVTAGGGSYVLLVRLDDYCRFVSDESGNLRRYLFDSNVRDFLSFTRVNEDIAESLRTQSAPDFWWLNNGVTILVTNAGLSGKAISLQNIQIVNGLQTTESVYRYFRERGEPSDARTLLVKILESTDPLVRDRIIRATNNQNAVELASLHATDKIQRDIESILEKHEWYYERRRNYYRNIGKPPQRFVTPLYLASGAVALIFKNPALAATLKNRFMRNSLAYNAVFSEDLPLKIWPAIVDVFKRVEETLITVRSTGELGDKFVAKWRAVVALISVARVLGKFDYSTAELLSLDPGAVTKELLQTAWRDIQSSPAWSKGRRYRNRKFINEQAKNAADTYGLAGVDCVGRRELPTETEPISETFIDLVAQAIAKLSGGLDDKTIARELGCGRSKVRSAIFLLKRRGRVIEASKSPG